MSRYKGPRLRKVRQLGTELPGLTRKSAERKPYPPGQHQGTHRRKLSTYGTQMQEKQKLRFNYGVSETQLRRYMKMSIREKGNPGSNLLRILERRLDNAVFRMGLAPTIPAARQLVNHGHILVNAKRLDIASALVNVGDVITISTKGSKVPNVAASWEAPSLARPDWLKVEDQNRSATIVSLPTEESVPVQVKIQLVVEYYSRIVS